ncbi:unnamed protein product [Malus baccata var. baccata]
MELYHIESEIHDCVQGTITVSSYFTRLKVLWDERDVVIGLPDCDSNTLQHVLVFQQNQKAIKFPMGLNETFNAVKDKILLMDPLPPINKVYSLVLRHEKQQNTITGKALKSAYMKCARCNKNNHTTEACCAHLKCDYCGWKGHIIDYCRKLKRADPEQQMSHSNQEAIISFPFKPNQYKQIMTMLNNNKVKANNIGKNSFLNDLLGKAFSFTSHG